MKGLFRFVLFIVAFSLTVLGLDVVEGEQLLRLLSKIDENGDGKMSTEEIMSFWRLTHKATLMLGVDDQLDAMDGDKDGKISLEEFDKSLTHEVPPGSEPPPPMSEAEKAEDKEMRVFEVTKFKEADTNSDGFVDKTEFSQLAVPEIHENMRRMTSAETVKGRDTNGDGALSVEEFWQVTAAEVKAMRKEEWKLNVDDFNKIDSDKNGKLNAKEVEDWESGAFHAIESFQELMAIVDDNKDGHITLNELEKHKSDMEQIDATLRFQNWVEHHEL